MLGNTRAPFHSFLRGPCKVLDQTALQRLTVYGYTAHGAATRETTCNATSTCAARHAGYQFLFNGCPRGGLVQTAVRRGKMSLATCQDICDRQPACNAIEVTGCLNNPDCGKGCYTFTGTGTDVRNGGCNTNGDMKAYRKGEATER